MSRSNDQIAFMLGLGVAAFAGYLFGRSRGRDESPRILLPDSGDFQVEVYPPGADLSSIVMPTTATSISVSADCSVVAVATGWWLLARQVADESDVSSTEALADLLFARFAPTCVGKHTDAAQLFREEIIERFSSGFPERNFSLPTTVRVPQICGSQVCPPGWTCKIEQSGSTACQMPSLPPATPQPMLALAAPIYSRFPGTVR